MPPLYRNIAIAAALVALPGRIGHHVREIWEDDTVEGGVKRLAARLEELTDRLEEMRRPEPEPPALLGRLLAFAGITVLVPAAITASVAPDQARNCDTVTAAARKAD